MGLNNIILKVGKNTGYSNITECVFFIWLSKNRTILTLPTLTSFDQDGPWGGLIKIKWLLDLYTFNINYNMSTTSKGNNYQIVKSLFDFNALQSEFSLIPEATNG